MNTITIAGRREIDAVRPSNPKPGAPVPKAAIPSLPAPTPELIQARAYEIYRERNGEPGDETTDWLQAERELRAKAAQGNCGKRPSASGPGSRGEVLLSDED